MSRLRSATIALCAASVRLYDNKFSYDSILTEVTLTCGGRKKKPSWMLGFLRAVNEARTRDPQLGKLMLYQLSYYRIAMETAQN